MKVTLNDIMDKIADTTYVCLPDGRTTVCQLTMENGYTVNGFSACADPTEFNKALGEKYAYEDAINKVWPLEGYLLAEKLYREESGDLAMYIKGKNQGYNNCMLDMLDSMNALWDAETALYEEESRKDE